MKSKLLIFLTAFFIFLILFIPIPLYSSSCDSVVVKRVVDGDTFVTDKGIKVRLLGIDTPETTDPRRDVQWFGQEASKRLKTVIEGREVCLKGDTNKTIEFDKYGRLLRYVWIQDRHVNAELVSDGYAFAYAYQPFQYIEEFTKLEKEARMQNRGLWNDDAREEWLKEKKKEELLAQRCGEKGTICPEDSRKYVDNEVTVRFFVRKSRNTGHMIFLNSRKNYKHKKNFTVVIFRKDALQFLEDPAETYLNKTIDITGEISLHKNRPQIVATTPSQIRLVNNR